MRALAFLASAGPGGVTPQQIEEAGFEPGEWHTVITTLKFAGYSIVSGDGGTMLIGGPGLRWGQITPTLARIALAAVAEEFWSTFPHAWAGDKHINDQIEPDDVPQEFVDALVKRLETQQRRRSAV